MIRATRDFAVPDEPRTRGNAWKKRQAKIAHELACLNRHNSTSHRIPIAKNPPIGRPTVGQAVYLRWSAIPECDWPGLTSLRTTQGRIAAISRDRHSAVQVNWGGGCFTWVQAEYLCAMPEVDW